jgi:hypothetical protein
MQVSVVSLRVRCVARVLTPSLQGLKAARHALPAHPLKRLALNRLLHASHVKPGLIPLWTGRLACLALLGW